MSEFIWPPPDDELELEAAALAAQRTLERRHRGVSRRRERTRPEHGKREGFAWPPADADLSAPASVEDPEPAGDVSPGAVRLDAGLPSPPVVRRTPARRAAFGLGSRGLAMFATGFLLAVVTGGMWQIASWWNAAPQQPRSSASTGAHPRSAGGEIDVAPSLSTPIPADRSPVEDQRESKAIADAAVTERELPATPTRPPAATPRAGDERQDRPTPGPATRATVDAPSETVIASTTVDTGLPPRTAVSERASATRRQLELARLVEPSLPAAAPSTPVSATALPTAKPAAEPRRRVANAGIASRSPSAGSRSAPALDEDREAIAQLVDRYQAAFDERDADAAAAVWPSVDAPALARAFEDVQEQDLRLDRCDVAVKEEQATASCPGALSYVRRVGPSDREVARHVWTFLLERHERGWLIAEVTAR